MFVITRSPDVAKILLRLSQVSCSVPVLSGFWLMQSSQVKAAEQVGDQVPEAIPENSSKGDVNAKREANTPLAKASAPELVNEVEFSVSRSAADLLPPKLISENLGKTDGLPVAQTTNPVEVAPIGAAESSIEKPVTPENPGSPQPPKVSPVTPTVTRPRRDDYSINVEQYYYNWNDKLGNRGNQIVMPLTATYSKGNFDVGVRAAYIRSQFKGNLILDGAVIGKRQGEVSTLSDTSVSLAYTLKQSRVPVRFNLDVNVPTGKATLKGDEKNAIMDGALVQQTRFGEGLNLAPGISVSYAVSPNDVVGVGLSHIIRGKFDPNGDVVNDEINPGNETVATLQYQHSAKKWLAIGGLIYTRYGTTTRGGEDYYRSGDRFDVNGTLVVAPNPGQRVQLSGRYFTQARNTVVNFFTGDMVKESANSNGNALFLSGDWGFAVGRQQRGMVHLLTDWLKVNANSYDRVNDLFNAGRSKVSLGVGYDYSFSAKTRVSVQAKYFWLTDKATPVTQQDVRSNGVSLFASLNHNF